MARTNTQLTVKEVERLKTPGMHAVGPSGLYLQISGANARSWVYRYQIANKPRWAGLGSADTVSLAEARARRDQMRTQIHAGTDPLDERDNRKRAAETAPKKPFRQVATDYIANHEAGWKSAVHRAQWTATLKAYAFPTIGDLAPDAITTEHIRQILQPIWHSKPETARRVRGRIERILNSAKTLGMFNGENPARWSGHLENVFPGRSKKSVQHHPAMPYAELTAFMERLRQHEGIAARALEFTILTAARTNETLGATWSELDLAGKVWVVPGHRMKAGQEHRVPLSARAVEIVNEMADIRIGDLVFPGMRDGAALSNMSMLKVLARLDCAQWTVHGFRSTFRDWAAETTAHPNHVVEMALAHAIGDEVEAAYRRGDLFTKRIRLMDDWSGYCGRVPAEGNVIDLPAARQAAV